MTQIEIKPAYTRKSKYAVEVILNQAASGKPNKYSRETFLRKPYYMEAK